MVGFAQSMYKLLINGRSQEVIDTINSNFKHIREVFLSYSIFNIFITSLKVWLAIIVYFNMVSHTFL